MTVLCDPVGERHQCGGEIVYNGRYYCEDCDTTVPFTVDRLVGLIRYRRSLGRDTTREEFYLPVDHAERHSHPNKTGNIT